VPHGRLGEPQALVDRVGDALLLEPDVLGVEQDLGDLETLLIERNVLQVHISIAKQCTFVELVNGVALLLELVVGHHEVLEVGVAGAPHILHEVPRGEAHLLLDLLDQLVAVLEIEVPEGQNFLEVVGEQFPANIDPTLPKCYLLIADFTGLPSKKGVM
jgi:hypothetical protein